MCYGLVVVRAEVPVEGTDIMAFQLREDNDNKASGSGSVWQLRLAGGNERK